MFDCGATFKAWSSPACLSKPFRQEPVDIMADVEGVAVHNEDSDPQALWRSNGDCTGDLVEYKMVVN